MLTKTLLTVSDWELSFTRTNIRKALYKYLQRVYNVKEFKKNVPRHDLKKYLYSPEQFGSLIILFFFSKINLCLLYNYDDTNVQGDSGLINVVVSREIKHVKRV